MAAKNPILQALTPDQKNGLAILTRAFDLDWSQAIITSGVDAVKARISELDAAEKKFYEQNAPLAIVTEAEKQLLFKASQLERQEAAKAAKIASKAADEARMKANKEKQVSLF